MGRAETVCIVILGFAITSNAIGLHLSSNRISLQAERITDANHRIVELENSIAKQRKVSLDAVLNTLEQQREVIEHLAADAKPATLQHLEHSHNFKFKHAIP